MAADFRAGAGAVKITPPQGAPMAGYYNDRAADGVHDDLFAKALVFESGGEKAALVVCDLISMTRTITEKARALIERETGLRGDHVMISATHSHTGPVLSNRTSREDAQGGSSSIAVQYAESLPGKIAQAVKLAIASTQPARISAGSGREEELSFNRRYLMRDGSVGWNPGKLNPKILEPAGPIDASVPIVYVQNATNSKALATYVNFAMHLDTVGGLEISADYPFTLSTLLGNVKGADMVTLFSIGTAGDINHVNVNTRDPQKGPEEAARIGTILAAAVLKTYPSLKSIEGFPIRVRSEMVRLPLPSVTPADVEKAGALATRYGTKDEPKFLEKVWAFKVLDVAARQGKPQEVEVQVIALGDRMAFVSLPGEIFVELGLAIKKASPFPNTIIVELANGSIGYIPTKRAFAQGNYEVVSARCAEGSGELLVETALRLLQQVRQK
jgi:hypothetical protein